MGLLHKGMQSPLKTSKSYGLLLGFLVLWSAGSGPCPAQGEPPRTPPQRLPGFDPPLLFPVEAISGNGAFFPGYPGTVFVLPVLSKKPGGGSSGESAASGGKARRNTIRIVQFARSGGTWRKLEIGDLERNSWRMGLLPLVGKDSVWTLGAAAPGLPLQGFRIGSTGSWRAVLENPPGTAFPFLSDLDGNGLPELWWLDRNGTREEGPVAVWRPAPGAPPDTPLDFRGLDLGGGFAQVLFGDFNGDLIEDLLLAGPGRKTTLVANQGGLEFDTAEDGRQPRGREGARLEASWIRLGPRVAGRQWALARTREAPLLLARELPGGRFHPAPRQPESLRDRGVLDARFLDCGLDGRIELCVLAADGLRLWTLPERGSPVLLGFLPLENGSLLRLGDLDGDHRPDLVVLRGPRPPLFLRMSPVRGDLEHGLSISLEGKEEWPHALGAVLELVDAEGRGLEALRWPPQAPGDQACLFLGWSPLRSGLGLVVTWPDRNATEYPLRPGGHLHLKPE